MLRLGYSKSIARHDQDLVGIGHDNRSIAQADLLVMSLVFCLYRATGFATAERADKYICQRPVHGLAHENGKQGTGSAHKDTPGKHYFVIIKKSAAGSG